MTAQQINHISSLAAQRATTSEQWDAVVSLKLLAWSAAQREIAAHGRSNIYAALAHR